MPCTQKIDSLMMEIKNKTMKKSKLLQILKTVGHVRSAQWRIVMLLVESIKSKEAIVKKKKWEIDYKKNQKLYPLDLSKIYTWSTFNGTCVDLYFTTEKNDLHNFHCYVKIYDGDSFHGHRTNLRFTAELFLPSSFLHKIENEIMCEFNSHLENEYEKHLEKQKQDWINKMRISILSK